MKQAVNTILRKCLDQFECQSGGSKGWFKLDIDFFRQIFLKFIQNSIKHSLKRILKIKTWKCIKRFLYLLINILSRQKRKKTKHDFSIRSTSARRNSGEQTSKIYSFLYILFVFINGRNRFNTSNKSKCKS